MGDIRKTLAFVSLAGLFAAAVTVDVPGQTGASPGLKLNIVYSPPTGVTLTWPQTAVERVLEQADSLAPPVVWKPVAAAVTMSGNLNTLTLPGAGAPQFYRLKGMVDIAQLMRDHAANLAADLPLQVSLTNAFPDLPFLDDFNPTLLGPLSRVPTGTNGSPILFPGLWEIELESYCLKTGTTGPTEGDGYLPLAYAGPRADIIQKVLQGLNPEANIAQESAQILLWAIILRTPLETLPAAVQDLARQLLSADDLRRLAVAVAAKTALEDEYVARMTDVFLGPDGLFKDLPASIRDSLRQGNQFETSLRENANVSYDTLQSLAFAPESLVELAGTPREIPRGRWAWIPASPSAPYGFLARYLPFFYDVTIVQYCVPEDLAIEADNLGRITAIEDGQGQRIETVYEDTLAPLEFNGDPSVRGYAFRSIRLIGPADPENPRQLLEATKGGLGWTLVGVPAGTQTSTPGGGRYVNADQRYAWTLTRIAELNRLDREFTRVHPGRPAVAPGITANLINLAGYGEALRQALAGAFPEEDPQGPYLADRLGLAYRAWISQLTAFCVGNPGASPTPLRTTPPDEDNPAPLASIRASGTGVSGFSLDSLFFWRKPKPAPKPVTSSWYEYTDNLNHGIPSVYVHAGSYGTQNLGLSNNKTQGARQRANEDLVYVRDASGKLLYVVNKAHSVAGVPAPWTVPLQVVKAIIDGTVNLFYAAADILGSLDPPRSDFTTLAVASIVDPGPLTPDPGMSAQRLQAARAFLEADLRLAANFHAAAVSYERQGGAVRAANHRWSVLQAAAVVHFQREAARAMLDTADALERWLNVLLEEGVEDYGVEKPVFPAIRDAFRAGFPAETIAALRQLGLADEEIDRCRQGLIAMTLNEDVLGMLDSSALLFQALRQAGRQLMTLPVVTLPTEITP